VLTSIRGYRGAAGPKMKNRRKHQETFSVNIPKADKKKHSLVKLNTAGKWLIIGDLHVPFHDEKAVEAAVKHGYDNGCKHLLVNGDALDAYQQSCWVKDPTARNTDGEIELLKKMFAEFSRLFPGEKVYKIGNHEERIESYLFLNAPKMIGMSKWDLRVELQKALDIPSWTMIGSKQLYTLGKLNGYHGHELPKGLTNPVSVGRGLWLRTKQTGFTNHWHSTSTHVESNGSKSKNWVCFSIGALCNLHPDYAPINGWNHGLATVEIDAGGNFSESNHRIFEGKIW